MDTTDIFLNRLSSADEVYDTVSKRVGCESIKDEASLNEYLDGLKKASFKIYLSSEEIDETPAHEALACFENAAKANKEIKINTVVDEFVNIVDENDRIISKLILAARKYREQN